MAVVNSAFSASASASAQFNTTHRNGAFSASATAQVNFASHIVKAAGFPNKQLGLKAELLLNGTWTDITKYILVRDPVTISPLGRTDESSSMQPGSMTFTLKNTDGRFTPNNTSGAYYPYIQLNTRMRLSVNDQSVTGVAYTGYRFWGEVSEWPMLWDPSGRDVSDTVTVSGIWRRLSHSTKTLGSPFTRWNQQMAKSFTQAGYWPMEDGTASTSFASLASTGAAMTIIPTNGQPTMASCTAFPGSDAIPQLNGAELSGLIHTSASPSQIIFRFLLFVQAGGDTGAGAANTPLARLHLGTNTSLNYVDVTLGPAGGGPFTLNGYDSGNHLKFSSTLNDHIWGIPIMVQVGLVQSGSNVIWSLNTILPHTTTWYGTTTGTATGMSIADASSVIFSPGASWKGISVGQAVVYYANPSITLDASALGGWLGENALTRFKRLCSEQGVATESIGTTTTAMGPQIDDTFVNALQTIEDTDGGFLYETRDQFGLGYRTMASLQNQAPVLTLSYPSAQLAPGLAPVNDDGLVRNDVILANYDGYSSRTFLQNGARSLNDPPNGVGTGYEYTRNVNSTSHAQVDALGSQILDCGCTFENRYPTATVNFARTTTAGLFSSAPAVRQGDYLQITGMPSFMGGGTEKQLVWGWTETLSNYTWTIAYNTIPELPWESSFNPGASVLGQVPGSPVTAGQSGNVSGAQIAEGAIIGQNIASGTIQGDRVAVGTITAVNIADATITAQEIANATITGTQIAAATITGTNIGPATIIGTNIAAGAITGTNIASATILGSNIAVGTITASNITNATITSAQMSATAGITGSQIAGGTITAGNITSATITNVQIAGSTITGSNIGASTITGANIANATVTSVQISNGTITTTQISNTAAITGTQIASATVAGSNIVAGTITGSLIAASTITGGLIAATTIAAGNIVANTITAAQIAAATITATQIASATITATQIAAATITGAKIAAGTITASNITSGTITTTQIAASTITAGNLAAGIVVAGIVDATTITGAQLIADGSTGEILVYTAAPAAGNLIGSWSATSGTDSHTNAYNAGLWIYDTGGNSIGLVPGAAAAASQIAFTIGGGTPVPPSGTAGMYGAGSGAIQAVDATDGNAYSVSARRSLVPTGDQNVTSTGFNSWVSSTVAAPGSTARVYRIHGIAFVAPNQTGGKAAFEWTGPVGASGHLDFLFSSGTSMENSGALNLNTSTSGVVAMTMVNAREITVTIDGALSVPAGTSGTFALQAACATAGDTFIIRAFSFVDIMPV